MSVLWFRRDLRLRDHPALLAAAADGPVTALFVLDEALLRPAGAPRVAFLYRTPAGPGRRPRASTAANWSCVAADPRTSCRDVAREVGARAVHISADFGPYGAARDTRVEPALGGVALVRTGSPYAVAPGRVTKADGIALPGLLGVLPGLARARLARAGRAPTRRRSSGRTAHESTRSRPIPQLPAGLALPDAGEAGRASRPGSSFGGTAWPHYADERDRPDLDSTSRLSPYLHFGAAASAHPAGRARPADETFRKELAWREFYAAVLHFWPASARTRTSTRSWPR